LLDQIVALLIIDLKLVDEEVLRYKAV